MTEGSPLGADTTPGLVCAHHHLYSALARGMPAPPHTPTTFLEILEQVWWRLDAALDLEIIDHHESPSAIEGSLTVIADACAEVGVRVSCAYGVTDRHGAEGAARGLAENDRYLSEGGHGMVGVHAAFTCSDATLVAAAELAARHGVGVHIHVAEGPDDVDAPARLVGLSRDDWVVVHGVHLTDDHAMRGSIVHNPRSNMNNAVGYARPARFTNPVALGTDGIGADLLDEFRVAYARLRESDVTQTPETAWDWLATGWKLMPGALDDQVRWSYEPIDAWRLAFTTGVRPIEVRVDGEIVLTHGQPTRVDPVEIRAKAAEQAARLFARL